ncbi:ATP-dependent RNA helicase homolog DQX1 isoform X2 [Ictidomys tridecemlineatus]|uniref:ATP-dependent RNA helicase DQX1 isoform X2 n=1 Tax=Ictidomys tridecemlineatus TaxID=43179 RepID=UPI001A9F5F1F|nr:ATP-dependent RNA helicase DQX1 isoform X2 [Ictidomys tridecemlineatus]
MASQPPRLAEECSSSPRESELAVNPFDGLPFSSRYYELLEQRRALPIWAARFTFLEHLESSPTGVVLVSGEPGSGKSTQIPQWCAEFALARGFQNGQVTVTQPYPLAALSLAVQVADEMDLTLGHEVGYSIPQENCTESDTLLRFCWDRLLLQEVASSRGVGGWGVLVLDEAQERSVASDSLQGLLRDIKLRNLPGDPKVVVVTDPALEPKLQAFWGNPPTVHIPKEPGGSPTPVYRDTIPIDPVEAACQAVLELCQKEVPGDVLVYLSSEEEISLCCESLSREVGTLALPGPQPRVLPLHPGCGQAIQAVYEDTDMGARKVVVTHWLADFSFSLPSIHHVIDSGLELRSSFLELEAPPLPQPRVCEENLSPLVLLLKRRQIAEPGECHFLDRPAPEALMQALEDLDYLAALDDDGDLSDLGVILSEFPLSPELAKALLASCEFDCVDEMLTLAAMLTVAPGFTRPPLCAEEAALRRGLEHPDGDHSSLIQVYEAFIQSGANEAWCQARGLNWAALCQACKLRGELQELMQQIELPLTQPAFGSEQNRRNLQKALVSGYFLKVARDTDGTGNYLLLTHKHVAQLSSNCCYQNRRPPARPPQWVLYHSFSISKDNCLSIVSEIQPQMLVELAPPYFLSNLPPSESRDLLNQLRKEMADSSAESESSSIQEFRDACVLQ